jgi:hypothetical protein
MRDLYNHISALPALASASVSAAATGDAVDLLQVSRITFVVNTGAVTGAGDFGVTIEESDNGTTGWTAAPVGHVQTDAPATLAASSVYRLGYLGWKRFVRLSLAKAGGTSIQIGAAAVTENLTRPADA